ncbi:hypothetical protein [Microbacterium dauci]|uniref:Uncharacterized protein n=1 Tax=Microbacterium dauci TaxID=3048008 RepID=A0ABT6ZAM8_9MICO|nr:hypothetical protein [Microbacterium sp. LX3-4]MDJ1113213.1 hypothetical protein [Microbacterium sp. LX3-4]
MRWLIRREPVRSAPFGAHTATFYAWVVRTYLGTRGTPPEERKLSEPLVEFNRLSEAHRWATGRSIIHRAEHLTPRALRFRDIPDTRVR